MLQILQYLCMSLLLTTQVKLTALKWSPSPLVELVLSILIQGEHRMAAVVAEFLHYQQHNQEETILLPVQEHW